MVPLGAAEAFYLEQTIEAMDGRAAVGVKRRFERVMGELERVGLLERLRKREGLNPEQLSQLDRDYFAAQIACPFLVDRSCSIHARRPLACREFLVTSPARHCRDPDSGKVREIRMPAKVSKALWETGGSGGWLPLALAREFAATHQEDSIDDAAAAVQDVLENL
jgi:Fe-S-cluster containining protein